MKGAIVVVSAAEEIEKCIQLIQHLAAAKLAKLENLIVLFNKLDLVSDDGKTLIKIKDLINEAGSQVDSSNYYLRTETDIVLLNNKKMKI